MRSFVMHDEAAVAQFEEDIRSLVNAGHGARVIALVHMAAVANGEDDLAGLIDPKTLDPVIDRPEQLISDCTELAGLAGDGGIMRLRLHCESPSAPAERQGMIRREAQRPDGQNILGWSPDNSTLAIHLKGLDTLFELVRHSDAGEPSSASRQLKDKLALWAITGSFVKAVKSALGDAGFPAQITLELRNHTTADSMECGFIDLLPSFHTIITPPKSHDPDAAEQIKCESTAKDLERFQNDWIEIVAETRETHRLIRYFPFYRTRSRKKLAAIWEGSLAMSCSATGVDPKPKISWRMNGNQLTAILRRIVERKAIPDVEDALDPEHTDALHERELAEAKAEKFKFQLGLSMFSINLAYAIKFGGPLVQDRWEHAKPYAKEMKLSNRAR